MEQALGGAPVQHGNGTFFRRHQDLAPDLCHGPFPLAGAARTVTADGWELLGLKQWAELDLSRAVYLDTETTGLAGGSGTYAFLVGLAYFQGGTLRVEQLVMRQHCEEKSMLGYLAERLADASCLVTFNGKSFDAPLLQTRLMMNRLRFSLDDMDHLDLLPISRRLWGGAFENCRLETLERELLGLPRHGDVPGFMIPQLFFKYLQTGCARGLAQVAEHNRRDVLTMVGLVAGLGSYAETPLQWEGRFRDHPPLLHSEDLSLAQQLFRRRRFDEAAQLLERVWGYNQAREAAPCPPLRSSGMLLARLHRRQGRPERARELWDFMAERFPADPEILEQVAKHKEHGLGDHGAALDWTLRALRGERLTAGRRKALLRRQERLQRRLDRVGSV